MLKSNAYLIDLDGSRKKNLKKRLFVALTISLIIFSLFATAVFAASCNCKAVDGVHTKGETYPCTKGWDPLRQIAYYWNVAVQFVTPTHFTDQYFADFNSGDFHALWVGLEYAYETIAAIGYLLVLLYFILEVIEQTTRDSFNLEHLLKLTIKLLVAVLLITNGMEILKGIAEIGNSMVRSLLGKDETNVSPTYQALYETYKDKKWYNCFGDIISALFPFILSGGSKVVISLVIYTRYIEIGIRALFAPIGMANIFESGLNSSGMKYLKKFAATCFQGAIILGVVTASDLLAIGINGDSILSTVGIGDHIILQLCTMIAVIKSKSWANDIMGV